MKDPYNDLQLKDSDHRFLCLCTFISICENKRLSFANILLLALNNDRYKWLFYKGLDIETDYNLVKLFLEHDPFLYKSKHISKFFKNKKHKNK